jgi:uncharacterized membrane protein YbhN (UPF0104 family)
MTSPARTRTRTVFGFAVAAAIIALAGVLLYRTLGRYDFNELVASVAAVPPPRILIAIGWAAASYFWLTCSDFLSLHYAGHALSYPRVALASFTALSIGHNLGFAAVSSGAIRYSFYSRAGLSAEEIAKVIVFCGTTLLLGLCTLTGASLLYRPETAEALAHVGRFTALLTGVACLVVPGIYLVLAATLRGRLRLWRWTVEMPRPLLGVGQIVVGALNLACQAACLHAVISGVADVSYFETISAYILATAATIITHVPGGLGVIESVVLYLLPDANLVGAVLVFRCVYFLLPLVLGGLVFAIVEAKLGVLKLTFGGSREAREAFQK